MNTLNQKTAIVIGATGLVGSQLIRQLVQDPSYKTVYQIVRRAPVQDIALGSHKLQSILVADFSQLENTLQNLDLSQADAFSTLGTTLKQAGSKQAFQQVDYDFNLDFATQVKRLGATHFLLLSATGADSGSFIFYNKVKGRLEQAVEQLGFAKLSVFQPSLLIGLHQDARLAEGLAQKAFQAAKSIIPATWAYRPIEAERVAIAMQRAASLQSLRKVIYSNADMLTLTLENNP